jgi:adenine deaminase
MNIHANLVNITDKQIYEANIRFSSTIDAISIIGAENPALPYITPGFIDSHIHIESSMLTPSQFARMAVVHGTVATISDPHEIANVCGMDGIDFMIADGKKVPFKFYFGAPSCVPATEFETAGATINVDDVALLLQRNEIKYLSEMMNFPGVLASDATVMAKIALAKQYHKPIDGHAPGLSGKAAKRYIYANSDAVVISTDHECFTAEEALGKLQYGMKILIREGSAAKNFDALIDLLNDWEDMMMFCSDDKHPDSLAFSHINELCKRAVSKGVNVYKVLKAACINPVRHYKLNVGQLQVGDAADFVILNNVKDFNVLATYVDGNNVAANGQSYITVSKSAVLNNFHCKPINAQQLKISSSAYGNTVPTIKALDGQLITERLEINKALLSSGDSLISNTSIDVLKIIVVNRYNSAPIAKGFVKNFGLQVGAIASTVAHDSHNIIAVGVDDECLTQAVNLVVEAKGGLSYATGNSSKILALPIAGLMTNEDGYVVSTDYTNMDKYVKTTMGATLASPYMTLSFMALLVIPKLKLSDKGLFDGELFKLL